MAFDMLATAHDTHETSSNSLVQGVLLGVLGAVALVAQLCGQLLHIVPRIGALAGRPALARLARIVDRRLQRAFLRIGLQKGAQQCVGNSNVMLDMLRRS